MPPHPSASGWAAVADDMRRALLRSGGSPAVVEQVLADLAPVFIAVERARGRVEDDLAFALLSVAADRMRRGVLNARSRMACEAAS